MKKTVVLFLLLFAICRPIAAETVATLQEIKKFVGMNDRGGDKFGCSLSMDDDIMAIGTCHTEDGPWFDGYIYLFQKDRGGVDNWGFVKKVLPPESEETGRDNFFGNSVVVSGDTLFVGDFDFKNDRSMLGAVYIFQKDEGGKDNWGLLTSITSDEEEDRSFGATLAVSENMLAVGSLYANGSVHLFQQDESDKKKWVKVQKLTVSHDSESSRFGASIVIDDDIMLVGAPAEMHEGMKSGVVYVFEKGSDASNSWKEVNIITPSSLDDDQWFGGELSQQDNLLLVGARNKDIPGVEAVGAVYIFKKNSDLPHNWKEIQTIVPSVISPYTDFGSSLSFGDGFFVVGSSGTYNSVTKVGIYLFEPDENGKWQEIEQQTCPCGALDVGFGRAVAVDGTKVLVGALWDGDEDEGISETGSAYLFYKTEKDIGDTGNTTDSADNGSGAACAAVII